MFCAVCGNLDDFDVGSANVYAQNTFFGAKKNLYGLF